MIYNVDQNTKCEYKPDQLCSKYKCEATTSNQKDTYGSGIQVIHKEETKPPRKGHSNSECCDLIYCKSRSSTSSISAAILCDLPGTGNACGPQKDCSTQSPTKDKEGNLICVNSLNEELLADGCNDRAVNRQKCCEVDTFGWVDMPK